MNFDYNRKDVTWCIMWCNPVERCGSDFFLISSIIIIIIIIIIQFLNSGLF